jgi:3-dehydroquinate dehydratase-2
MSLAIAIINGPNLNLLGSREPEIYGQTSFEDCFQSMQQSFPDLTLSHYQSNVEGELINYLHDCRGNVQGIILNAGGYTHTSVALADAIAAIDIPVVELHISNVFARESYRRTSYIAAKCVGSISGLGLTGYELAVTWFVRNLSAKRP